MSAIIEGDPTVLGMKIKVMRGDRKHRRVDLHDIDLRPGSGEIHWHHAHTEPYAEHVMDVRGVSSRQRREHIGKGSFALLAVRVVDVLDEVIIQIVTR